MNPASPSFDPGTSLTAASLLFGFLFTGFWWALDRELKFEPEQRHFKLGYCLLLLTMAVVAGFGILVPLWRLSVENLAYRLPFRASCVATVGVFGYMLTEFGHYRVFQRPKYTTWQERLFFWATLAALGLGTCWLFRAL
ncbi:MAG: hypothetical protein ACR2L2_03920 [Acidobacteriota bacterium]